MFRSPILILLLVLTLHAYRLDITTQPTDAKVFLEDLQKPYRSGMALPPGNYRLKIERFFHETQWVEIDLNRDRELLIVLESSHNLVSLHIARDTETLVRIIGNGKTIVYSHHMHLPEGNYTIRATRTGYLPWERNVTLDDNGLSLSIDLKRDYARDNRLLYAY